MVSRSTVVNFSVIDCSFGNSTARDGSKELAAGGVDPAAPAENLVSYSDDLIRLNCGPASGVSSLGCHSARAGSREGTRY